MLFERAIEGASTLFLFDRRTQQALQEMADGAEVDSRDLQLIRLSQAAFAYYNAVDTQAVDMRRIMQHGLGLLKEVKHQKADRVFTTLAMRLEVDILVHWAALNYREAEPDARAKKIFTEEDARALSICEAMLKNLPKSFDPLPSAWYTGVLPLFPPFRNELLQFYKDRVQENRVVPLASILEKVRADMVIIAGIIRTKQFLSEHSSQPPPHTLYMRFMCSGVKPVARFMEEGLPPGLNTASDINLPKGISGGHMENAVRGMHAQIEQARKENDLRRFTSLLLQLGIMHFLRDNPTDAIGTLVRTLRASHRLNPEDKRLRQYRHEEFADIPFMIGTGLLRLLLEEQPLMESHRPLLRNCISALLRAISLQHGYHQAFINLIIAQHLDENQEDIKATLALYLEHFNGDFAKLSSLCFRNLAWLEIRQSDNRLTPEIVRWVLLSQFASGGELTRAHKVLQELKTLYILNAHEFSITYLEVYRRAFRSKDEEFIKDLEDSNIHSALLFYIAHGYGSSCIMQTKKSTEVTIDYDNLARSIELNSDSLYFNPNNGNGLRLIDTQGQILQFGLSRTHKRWESINQMMGQRFMFYEDFLRLKKCHEMLAERLTSLGLEKKIPEFKPQDSTLAKMREALTEDQRERLRSRVFGK
ncbi:MAG: hypothetical protein OEW39_10535 [Deltaproteobacteria bacterium]|nr:hypothetical protein [Deltaproteobacteria bacterium]